MFYLANTSLWCDTTAYMCYTCTDWMLMMLLKKLLKLWWCNVLNSVVLLVTILTLSTVAVLSAIITCYYKTHLVEYNCYSIIWVESQYIYLSSCCIRCGEGDQEHCAGCIYLTSVMLEWFTVLVLVCDGNICSNHNACLITHWIPVPNVSSSNVIYTKALIKTKQKMITNWIVCLIKSMFLVL